MSSLPKDPTALTAEPAKRPQWQRGHNGHAITIAVLIHLALLAAILSWRSKAPPPEPRILEISIVEAKQPLKVPEPPPPPPKLPKLPKLPELPLPNMLPVPELPPIEVTKVDPVPQAVAPLVTAAPAPAPAPPAVSVASPPTPAAPAPSSPVPPKLFEECKDSPDRKMIADVFRLRPSVTSVTEIRRLKPINTVCLAQLDVTPRKFTDGFPGLDVSEWFALDIRFTVNVPEDGRWELMLLSDDGAILTVDGVEVINNDGIHAPEPVMATVKLAKGLRNFRVRYFQGPAPDLALMLGWKKPGAADFQYIPRRLLGRPAAASAPG